MVCKHAANILIAHLKQTPDSEARVSLILAHHTSFAFTHSQWLDVENHLHKMSRCRVTASDSSFHVTPDNDKKTRRDAPLNFRDTCVCPRILLACLPLAYYFSPKAANAGTAEWAITRFVLHRGRRRWRREGGRAACEVRDWHPTFVLPVLMVTRSGCQDGAGGVKEKMDEFAVVPGWSHILSFILFLAPGNPAL